FGVFDSLWSAQLQVPIASPSNRTTRNERFGLRLDIGSSRALAGHEYDVYSSDRAFSGQPARSVHRDGSSPGAAKCGSDGLNFMGVIDEVLVSSVRRYGGCQAGGSGGGPGSLGLVVLAVVLRRCRPAR